MHDVSILQSLKDHKLYIGRTHTLLERLFDHARGHVDSTRHRRPFILASYEA